MRQARQDLRPRSLPDLLDAGMSIYRNNFLHFIGIAALSQLPLGLVTAVLTAVFFSGQAPTLLNSISRVGQPAPAVIAAALSGALLFVVISFVATSFSIAALLHSLQARLNGSRPGVLQAYSAALRRVPSLLLARFLYFLGTSGLFLLVGVMFLFGIVMIATGEGGSAAIGIIMLLVTMVAGVVAVLGAIYLAIRWRFHPQTSYLEGQGPVSALRRSKNVVRGRWWFTLGFVIVLWLFTTALSATPTLILQMPLQLATINPEDANPVILMLANTVQTIVAVLLFPVNQIILTLLYYDYRVRGEALDLQLAVSDLRETPSQS